MYSVEMECLNMTEDKFGEYMGGEKEIKCKEENREIKCWKNKIEG